MAEAALGGSELLTIPEAAALLRLRPSTLRDWRYQRRKLPFLKFSRRVFVRRSDVEALIESGLEPASEPEREEPEEALGNAR